MITIEDSYEIAEPTIDTHVVKLKAANPDVLLIFTTPKFAAQTIKKTAELGWKPLQILANVSVSVGAVMQPAGFDNAQGVLSASYTKDGTDSQWKDDPGMKKWNAFLDKYMPDANKADSSTVYGYGAAQTLVKVLQMCGDDLTRANVMKQAASLKDFTPDTLLPGITINTSPTDFAPISQLQMQRFKGDKWERFGEIFSADVATQ
jgi:branched-chain amino acid transport system substrate-binding protein